MTEPSSPGLAGTRVERADGRVEDDLAVVESPLEIRVDGQPLAVTLRTPGQDEELAAGFLFSEGVIDDRAALAAIEPPTRAAPDEPGERIFVRLDSAARDVRQRLRHAQRELLAVAACGLCGKQSLDDLRHPPPRLRPMTVERQLLEQLPQRMRVAQTLFQETGGLHAAALFDAAGRLQVLREDIGRHNAVDKVIGRRLLDGALPLDGHILVTSGRAGYEIVQKALRAAVPVLGAVGAASSLAIGLAQEAGMTLYSFLGPGRGNRHLPPG